MWSVSQIVLALLLVACYAIVWWNCRRTEEDPLPVRRAPRYTPPDRWPVDPEAEIQQLYLAKGDGDRYRMSFGQHVVHGDEIYILSCDDRHVDALIDRAAEWAADPELSFDEDDFMRVQRQMGAAAK